MAYGGQRIVVFLTFATKYFHLALPIIDASMFPYVSADFVLPLRLSLISERRSRLHLLF